MFLDSAIDERVDERVRPFPAAAEPVAGGAGEPYPATGENIQRPSNDHNESSLRSMQCSRALHESTALAGNPAGDDE